jgi:predicted nucleic acid-binding protein
VGSVHRVVVDPDVFVSEAITAAGATREIIDLIDAGELTPIVSPTLLVELTEVLRRDKFRTYLDLDTSLRSSPSSSASPRPGTIPTRSSPSRRIATTTT